MSEQEPQLADLCRFRRPIVSIRTGLDSLDRLLGDEHGELGLPRVGLVRGSVVLFGGDVRVGLSTIAVQVAGSFLEQGHHVVYVTAVREVARKQGGRLLGRLSEQIEIVSHLRQKQDSIDRFDRDPIVDKSTLVIVDTVHTFAKDPREQGALGWRFSMLAQETGATVILLDELSKRGEFYAVELVHESAPGTFQARCLRKMQAWDGEGNYELVMP